MIRNRFVLMSLGVLLVLGLVAACQGDDDETGGDLPTPTSTIGTPDEPTPTTPDDGPTATESGSAPTATPAAPDPTPEPTATEAQPDTAATATEADELTLRVYFIRDEKLTVAHRTVPRTEAVGRAALEELLAGPTDYESELGFVSSVPDGTEFLGLVVDDGVATVDLSAEFESGGGSFSMAARLAQVIYTLTQFPTVDAVEFFLDGEPVEVFGGEGIVMDQPAGRDFEDLLPAIFVETPAVGSTVTSPLTISGTANVFEANFAVRIIGDDGGTLVEDFVTATSGSGTRGTFEATIAFDVDEETPGTVMVFEYSARDGQPINIIEIPVVLEP